MKIYIISILSAFILLTACIEESDNKSSFSFSYAPGEVVNLPLGGTDQYLILSLNNKALFVPENLPDSLKSDGLQIYFSGITNGELEKVEYTDPSNLNTEDAYFYTINLTHAMRSQQNMLIRYGTSFGECLGYCNASLELKKGEIEYLYTSSDTVTFPDLSCTLEISTDSTDLLLDYLNKRDFYHLYSVYGCPDCNDGGAEWISVQHGNFYKKVTFEYMNEPDELTDLVTILRRFADYSECKVSE